MVPPVKHFEPTLTTQHYSLIIFILHICINYFIRPLPHASLFIWTKIFSLLFGLPPADRWKRSPKTLFFSMKATLMYSCGWMKIKGRFFKTITSRVIKVGNVFNATCGRGFFGKPGKNLRLQIKTDTWRQGLSYTLGQVIWRTWMTTLGVFTSYHRGIPNTISWGAPLENVGEWCALWIWPPTFCTEKREF